MQFIVKKLNTIYPVNFYEEVSAIWVKSAGFCKGAKDMAFK